MSRLLALVFLLLALCSTLALATGAEERAMKLGDMLPEEAEAAEFQFFKITDANGDRKISPEELKAFINRYAKEHLPKVGEKFLVLPEYKRDLLIQDFFKKMDDNGDGSIDAVEGKGHTQDMLTVMADVQDREMDEESLIELGQEQSDGNEVGEERAMESELGDISPEEAEATELQFFQIADANGDGKISPEELKGFINMKDFLGDVGEALIMLPEYNRDLLIQRFFKRMDDNGDGSIDEVEGKDHTQDMLTVMADLRRLFDRAAVDMERAMDEESSFELSEEQSDGNEVGEERAMEPELGDLSPKESDAEKNWHLLREDAFHQRRQKLAAEGQFFEIADANGDGKISPEELKGFINMYSKEHLGDVGEKLLMLPEENRDQLIQGFFKKMDDNGDGSIDAREAKDHTQDMLTVMADLRDKF